MVQTCIIFVETLILLCLCLHTLATICSNVGVHEGKVLEFCSGSNITGNNISLSTANASRRATNCTCQFTVTLQTYLHINSDCSTKILHGFFDEQVVEECGNILQFMETTQVLKIVYVGSENGNKNTNGSCTHFYTQQGLLEGACFEEPFIPSTETTETSTALTTTVYISTTDLKEDISTTEHKEDIPTTDYKKDISTTGRVTKTVYQSTTIAIQTTSYHDDNLQLTIVISASAGGIIFTLFVLITVLICLRKKNSKKSENERREILSSTYSVNQEDGCNNELADNDVKNSIHKRHGSQHTVTAYSDHDDTKSNIHIHVNVTPTAQVDKNDKKFDQADGSNHNHIYHNRNVRRGSRHTTEIGGNGASYDFIDLNTNILTGSDLDSSYRTLNEEESSIAFSETMSNYSESQSDRMSVYSEQSSDDEDVRTTVCTLPDTKV